MTLHTLYAANERRCAADMAARTEQYTILEIPALLFDLAFRHHVLEEAQGTVGEDTAALVGSTLLNLVKQEIQAQAALPPSSRRYICLIVDEFHSMPGADYEAFLGELAKFGSNLVLATQTLARLDGLFAFHCSAEGAKYLVPELGGEVEVADLVSLGEYRCYARLTAGKERLPVFSVTLDPPPPSDPALAARLAAASARRYGRSRQEVETARAAVVARITASHLTLPGAQRGDGADRTGKGPRFTEEDAAVRTIEEGGLAW